MAADLAPSAPDARRASPGRPRPDPDPRRGPAGGRGPGGWRGVAGAVGRRWPTWTGLALAAVQLSDGRDQSLVLLLAATGYLGIAVLDRPRYTWPVLWALLAVVLAGRAAGADGRVTLVVVAGLLLAAGLPLGLLARRDLRAAQAPALVVFGAVALGAQGAVTDAGAVLLAAGLLAHSAWDVIHLRARAVVSRSLAEWCCVLDATLGVGILVLTFA